MSSSIDSPPTMRAWVHTLRGTPSNVLTLNLALPTPHIQEEKAGDVLVKISHAALNPGGSILMHLLPFVFRHSPAVPEMDFSGTVISSGKAADERGLVSGTEVFGSVPVPLHIGGGTGALAEFAVVDSNFVLRKPSNASLEAVAGLGVAGCTALPLIERAALKRGDSVLVNGASGGIGSMVIQMARKIVGESGRVVAVCSGRNLDLVKGLGADEVIDYEAYAPVTDYIAKQYGGSKFNVVIDAVGIQEIWAHCPDYLIESGPFVTVGNVFEDYTLKSVMYAVYLMMIKNDLMPVWLGGVPRRHIRVTGLVNKKGLEKLAKLVEEGTLKTVIDSIWDMEDVLKAYEKLISKRASGKVIVKIESP